MNGLSHQEVLIISKHYIGVSGGYLGDFFSYRTLSEFYPEYCNLDININDIEGKIQDRFRKILSAATPKQQATIIHGVLKRFPVEASDAPSSRTAELREELKAMAIRLEGGPQISTPSVTLQAESLQRALDDAEQLIEKTGATSAVDRVHTALHAYLKALCDEARITVADDATLTAFLKGARQNHPALQPVGPRAEDITRVLHSLSTIADALGPVRNKASMAHPQPALLEPPEAMLVVHLVRTILHYFNARLEGFKSKNDDEGTQTTL